MISICIHVRLTRETYSIFHMPGRRLLLEHCKVDMQCQKRFLPSFERRRKPAMLKRGCCRILFSLLNNIAIKCIRMMIFIVDVSRFEAFMIYLYAPTRKKLKLKRRTAYPRGDEEARDYSRRHIWHVREKFAEEYKIKSLFTFELACRLPERHHFPHVTSVYSEGNCISSGLIELTRIVDKWTAAISRLLWRFAATWAGASEK